MTRLSVEFEWTTLGQLVLEDSRRLRFPEAPIAPGLYQFLLEAADERPGVYLGESGSLRRRFQQYRTPGATQRTNVRMRTALTDALAGGSRITVLVATEAHVRLEAREWDDLDLSRKNQRLVAELAAIAAALLIEDVSDAEGGAPVRPRLMNRPGVGRTNTCKQQ